MNPIAKILLVGSALWVSGLAIAQEQGAPTEFDGVKKCVEIQNDNERLTCYDTAMKSLGAALDAGNLVVLDKKAIESAKKDGFGLNLPSLSSLGGIFKSDGTPDIPGDVDSVELTLEKTKSFGYKKTRFHFTNGQVWDQIGTNPVKVPKVKNGAANTAVIKRGALGSFILRVNGDGKQIRVKRVE